MADAITPCHAYNLKRYTWRQVDDCVLGSVAIKQAGEVYLPMPSGMRAVPVENATTTTAKTVSGNKQDYQSVYMPWYHPNPAYRAYLQRARFPDIAANTLRGLIGIATRNNPEVKLPANLEYLLDVATPCGKNLFELYAYCIAEVIKTGKISLVLDVSDDGNLYIVPYCASANINWQYTAVNGKKMQVKCTFEESETDADGDEELVHFHYYYKDSKAYVQKYVDGDEFGPAVDISYKGKTIAELPIIHIGSVTNTAEPDLVPMLGMSDIALELYRDSADASHARYLTCNPTLFISGIDAEEVPKVIGSTVIVGLSNPAAKAYYPNTDTSALEHIRNHIKDLFDEAVSYGGHFLGQQYKAESGEALKIRQSSNGATLVHIVNQVAKGIKDILQLAVNWSSGSAEIEFEASTEFAEVTLSAQDVTALVSSWVQGGISHDTLLDNLRYAGIVDADKTNEDEIADIETSKPAIPESSAGGVSGKPA